MLLECAARMSQACFTAKNTLKFNLRGLVFKKFPEGGMPPDPSSLTCFTYSAFISSYHFLAPQPQGVCYTYEHFYFSRIVRVWNHLPVINTFLSVHQLKQHFINYLLEEFLINLIYPAPYILSVHVINV